MLTRLSLILASAALIATASAPVFAAAPCKDARGKFIKCPPPPPARQVCKDARGKFVKCPQKPVRCQDAKGKFAKCGTPGAKPV
jgi:hypothetical protein